MIGWIILLSTTCKMSSKQQQKQDLPTKIALIRQNQFPKFKKIFLKQEMVDAKKLKAAAAASWKAFEPDLKLLKELWWHS